MSEFQVSECSSIKVLEWSNIGMFGYRIVPISEYLGNESLQHRNVWVSDRSNIGTFRYRIGTFGYRTSPISERSGIGSLQYRNIWVSDRSGTFGYRITPISERSGIGSLQYRNVRVSECLVDWTSFCLKSSVKKVS